MTVLKQLPQCLDQNHMKSVFVALKKKNTSKLVIAFNGICLLEAKIKRVRIFRGIQTVSQSACILSGTHFSPDNEDALHSTKPINPL